jgi:hypothetical protein
MHCVKLFARNLRAAQPLYDRTVPCGSELRLDGQTLRG